MIQQFREVNARLKEARAESAGGRSTSEIEIAGPDDSDNSGEGKTRRR